MEYYNFYHLQYCQGHKCHIVFKGTLSSAANIDFANFHQQMLTFGQIHTKMKHIGKHGKYLSGFIIVQWNIFYIRRVPKHLTILKKNICACCISLYTYIRNLYRKVSQKRKQSIARRGQIYWYHHGRLSNGLLNMTMWSNSKNIYNGYN